jgi:hypothetical protein
VELQHRAVGGRRAVEGDLAPDRLGRGLQLLLVAPHHHEHRAGQLEAVERLADLLAAAQQGRQRDLTGVALGGEAVADEAVAHLARGLRHEGADTGEEDLGVAVGVGTRVEERGHQRM